MDDATGNLPRSASTEGLVENGDAGANEKQASTIPLVVEPKPPSRLCRAFGTPRGEPVSHRRRSDETTFFESDASSVFPEEIRRNKGVLSRPFLLLLKAEE